MGEMRTEQSYWGGPTELTCMIGGNALEPGEEYAFCPEAMFYHLFEEHAGPFDSCVFCLSMAEPVKGFLCAGHYARAMKMSAQRVVDMRRALTVAIERGVLQVEIEGSDPTTERGE